MDLLDRPLSIQAFEQYLRRRAPERRTAIDYVSDVRQFAAFCSTAWREVTMHDIDAFVDHQRQAGRSAATIKRRVAALKVFFDFLAEESGDLAWPNPVRPKRHAGKQAKRLPRDLSDTDVAALWAVISSPRDRAWFALMWRAGLRVGEVVTLELADILTPAQAEQPARLRVCGKGQKERLVLLTADAYAVLLAWLQVRPASPHPQVFLNQRGQPISANGIQGLLRNYGQQAGCAVTPHQFAPHLRPPGDRSGHADHQPGQVVGPRPGQHDPDLHRRRRSGLGPSLSDGDGAGHGPHRGGGRAAGPRG